LQHVGMEGQAIEQCGSQSLVTAKKLGPLGEGDGRGNDQTDMLVQGGETTRATCGVIGLFDILENESIFPRLAVQDRDRG